MRQKSILKTNDEMFTILQDIGLIPSDVQYVMRVVITMELDAPPVIDVTCLTSLSDHTPIAKRFTVTEYEDK